MSHATDARDDSLEYANTQKMVEFSRSELPLSCPTAGQKLWNAHPRVYLPIEDSGKAKCPYCGTDYVLTD